MGVDYHGLKFLILVRKLYGNYGSTLTLGRQEIHVGSEELKSLVGNSFDSKYAEGLLKEIFQSTAVQSMDNSHYEGADLIHDLNQQVPLELKGKFQTIIDLGTLEHVFDVANALVNTIKMLEVKGRIIHVLPCNNFAGHGFWQFSPELFFSLYNKENGFGETKVFLADLDNKRTWFEVSKPIPGQRVNITSSSFTYVLCVSQKTADVWPLKVFQSDYQELWDGRAASSSEPNKQRKFLRFRRNVKTEKRDDFKISRHHPYLTETEI